MSTMAKVWDISVDPEAAIDAAADAVAEGLCIVLPTDTVYGIGADATNARAVQGLLDAKERGRDMPPPVLVAEVGMLRALTDEVTPAMLTLAEAFWPGALTMVVKAHPHLRMDLGDRGETIAVRVPDHEFTRDLLRATGALAVSSANVSGQPAATTAQEAREQLGKRVKVYLDGGPASGGVPSTIVDLTGTPRILRDGKITREEIAALLPDLEPEPEPEPESVAPEVAAVEPEPAADELPDLPDDSELSPPPEAEAAAGNEG
ncbi:MAG: L-threonylcarbamoyladenylate synthase [Propionicimonas sp.]|uniref:L-threonylcarbamoyladenylate synthase n=1 Tax=Propionicimonas sp. TaxID=1955623 RepID=UPI003D1427E4